MKRRKHFCCTWLEYIAAVHKLWYNSNCTKVIERVDAINIGKHLLVYSHGGHHYLFFLWKYQWKNKYGHFSENHFCSSIRSKNLFSWLSIFAYGRILCNKVSKSFWLHFFFLSALSLDFSLYGQSVGHHIKLRWR